MSLLFHFMSRKKINPLMTEGVLVFDAQNSLLDSLYFPMMYLASGFPSLTTTKKYILVYSTDHATNAGGAIAWGEADNVDLSDFNEKGVIAQTGVQSETGVIITVPNDPNGETVHFYFHENGSPQQTRLWTTAGGAELHNSTWTDRGNVLGIEAGETHTGYANFYTQTDNSLVAIHHTQHYIGTGIDQINRFGLSTNNGSGYTWSRLTSRIDNTSFMPSGRLLHMSPPSFFTINGKQYCFGMNLDYTYQVAGRKICVVECEANNYLPSKFIANISTTNAGDDLKIAGFFRDDINQDIMHIYYTTTVGNDYSVGGTLMYHTTFDLRNL